ncbi:MAG: hypothetical protein P8Y58_16550 [Novosphingobium sp.]
MHIVGNMLISLNGDNADVESHSYGIHRVNLPDGGHVRPGSRHPDDESYKRLSID